MKRLIEILLISILLFSLAYIGCRDKAEANETIELNIEVAEPNVFESGDESTDIVFTYYVNGVTEEVTLDIIDNEIVCSRSAEKAIEIIFKSLYKCYISDCDNIDDLKVRFESPPEPNEPKEHLEWPGVKWIPEPNEPRATYTAEELDEIYKDEPELGILAKRLWGYGTPPEPKEPIQELVKLFEQVLDQEDRLIKIVGLCIERIKKLEENPFFNMPITENPTELVWTYPIMIVTEPTNETEDE